jgi:RNA polymerase sigma-70 factor, ECF subfamily
VNCAMTGVCRVGVGGGGGGVVDGADGDEPHAEIPPIRVRNRTAVEIRMASSRRLHALRTYLSRRVRTKWFPPPERDTRVVLLLRSARMGESPPEFRGRRIPAVHRMGRALPEQAATPEGHSALAERVRNGDPSAEEELVRIFRARVLVMMRARTQEPDAARDLCQDVLIAVLCALRQGQLRDTERIAAFVYGIARNTANSYLRTRRRHPVLHELSESVPAAGWDDPVESAERRRLVSRALESVTQTDRRILLLTLVEGLNPGEIAERLGLNDEVVRTRKSRALRKMIERVRDLSRT